MGELVEFLQNIHLEHLTEIFEKEAISLKILLRMTGDELKEIGINKFGHRKLILEETQKINELNETKDDDGYEDMYLQTLDSEYEFEEPSFEETLIVCPPETDNQIWAKAVYDFSAESADELTFRQGDVLEVIEQDTGGMEGWLLCSFKGKRGIAPGNRLTIITEMNYADYQSPLTQKRQNRKSQDINTNKVANVRSLPRSRSAGQYKAEDIRADFKYKDDSSSFAATYKTAFEQVSALFESIALKKEKGKRHFSIIYNKLLQLCDKKEFFDDLKDELGNECDGDIKRFINEGMNDLEDDSYPIVVTGETSAGKSTFVNLLLGVDILPQSSLSCTAAVCRIHYCEEKRVTLTYKSGKQTDLDISSDIEPKDMKKQLKGYVSIQSNKEAKSLAMDGDLLQFVDIFWPIKNIPKDLLIVDTPGVGPDAPHLTEKLYEYLPKALAFIYVLNAPNAGGVQKDRILQIQVELAKHQGEDKYFDPNRAIFICNKWDQIHEDEENPDEVFEQIQQKLSEAWYGFDPEKEKLFRLSAREEIKKCKAGKPISPEFKAILKGIKEMIPATFDEKLWRHVRKQKRFIDNIQKNVTARIKSTMQSKEEKIAMINRIGEKISTIETSISSKWHSVTDKAEEECLEIAKSIRFYINDHETKVKMFNWSSEILPGGSDYEQILKKIDAIVQHKVADEIRNRIQTVEATRLEEFVEHLLQDDCFTISKQVNEIEGLICGNVYDYEYAEYHTLKDDIRENTGFSLGKREKIFLAVSSPVLVPSALVLGLVAGIFILPVGAGLALKDGIKNMKKISKYRESKADFAKERAEMYLRELSKEDTLEQKVKEYLLKKIQEHINNFFSKVIPARLNSAKTLLKNIANDLRKPAIIRGSSQKVEDLIRPIYGQILAAEMDVFGERYIKHSDIFDVQSDRDKAIATFKYKKTTQKTVLKKVTFIDDKEAGWKCLAAIHAFRRLHHPHLLKIYGVCVLEPADIISKLYILQEVYDSDLAHEALKNRKPWHETYRYLQDALEGLSYLHISGLVHKNVCLENIMIKNDQGKLAEMGDSNCGVRSAVRAPEALESGEYGYESDIFQFGMIIWECCYNQRVYCDSQTFQDVSNRILEGERPIIKPPLPGDIEHCLPRCWHENPDKRPSAKEVQSVIAVSNCSTNF